MFPSQHFFSGLLAATFLFFLIPGSNFVGPFLLVFSTVLIDVDHYIYYIYKKKDFNLVNSYLWFIQRSLILKKMPREKRIKYYPAIPFFHGIEFVILSSLFGFFISSEFFFISAGIFLHLSLDLFDEYTKGFRLDRISLIYDFLKFRNLKYLD